jgi:protein SCO1/2
LIGLGILAGLLIAVAMPPPERPQAVEWLPTPRPVTEFSLRGANGAFTQQQLLQDWHLLLFGYSHCPDICPTTLTELRPLVGALQDQPIRVVFVSVDPERDKLADLASYTNYFHPDFIGVTGDELNLRALTDSIGVRYEVVGTAENTTVAHSIHISLIGPGGLLQGRLRPGFDLETAAREIREKVGAQR